LLFKFLTMKGLFVFYEIFYNARVNFEYF